MSTSTTSSTFTKGRPRKGLESPPRKSYTVQLTPEQHAWCVLRGAQAVRDLIQMMIDTSADEDAHLGKSLVVNHYGHPRSAEVEMVTPAAVFVRFNGPSDGSTSRDWFHQDSVEVELGESQFA